MWKSQTHSSPGALENVGLSEPVSFSEGIGHGAKADPLSIANSILQVKRELEKRLSRSVESRVKV